MDVVAGALGSVIRKLGELLQAEYELQEGLPEQIESLKHELKSAQTALRKVGEVPPKQLDPQVRLWAREVREASYDMEDILDTFLVEVAAPADEKKDGRLKRLKKNIADLFKKSKARHSIAGAIEDMKKRLQEVKDRRDRYSVAVALPAPATKLDPRLADMHKEVEELIGIDKAKEELMAMLLPTPQGHGDSDASGSSNMKIVSVVGVGGLGKTTLAKAVYDELQPRYDCGAFVSVGRKPDLLQVFTDIIFHLDRKEYESIRQVRSLQLLLSGLRKILQNKRYLIVIDDVWDTATWETIKLALDLKSTGSRVITTTRNRVANIEEVYELRPLSRDNSEKLFYTRLFGGKGECPANHPAEASEKILNKCGGVPLAVITMASLLVGKSREDWFDVCNSPGFYRGKGNQQVEDDTEWILSLSYYDLPSHLRTCLLYLNVYPEDYLINKDSLIWKWIAEGFVEKKTGSSLFQCGEEYFNQLINRSIIQPVEGEWSGTIFGCRVHDMVLDLIRGLSDEENFVTISNDDVEGTSSSWNKVRRLACHNRMMKQTQRDDHMGTARVRSLVARNCDIGSWVLHPSSFKLLRVLALEKCKTEISSQGLKHLGKLLHLRYLGLGYTYGIEELPEEIGKLKFLQTLDLAGSRIKVLPSGVRQLTQLVCLHGSFFITCVPDGLFLTNLTSLEELSACIGNLDEESQRQFVKDLGNLSEARMLDILSSLSGMVQSDLVQSLGNLHKLQRLLLSTRGLGEAATREWDTVVLPQHLQHLDIRGILFRRLPSWIGPVNLPVLYRLCLEVDDMDEAGLRALGGLPKLQNLQLINMKPSMTCMTTVPNITAGDGFFEKLRCCYLRGWMVQLVLNEDSTSVSFTLWNGNGAKSIVGSKTEDEYRRSVAPPRVMPDLQSLGFKVPARALYKDGNGGCYNLGLECLPSLRRVLVDVDCWGASSDDVAKAEAELKVVVELHPSRPKIDFERWNEDMMVAKSTDENVEESDGSDVLSVEASAGEEVTATDSRSGTVTI